MMDWILIGIKVGMTKQYITQGPSPHTRIPIVIPEDASATALYSV